MKHVLATSVFAVGMFLSGCGGGGYDTVVSVPTHLQVTDTTLGTGATAVLISKMPQPHESPRAGKDASHKPLAQGVAGSRADRSDG